MKIEKKQLVCVTLPYKFKTMTKQGKRNSTIVRWLTYAMNFNLPLANPVAEEGVQFGLRLRESLLLYVDTLRDRHNITRSECLTRLAIAGYRAERETEPLI